MIAITEGAGYTVYKQPGVGILKSRKYKNCSRCVIDRMTISDKCHFKGNETYAGFNMANI